MVAWPAWALDAWTKAEPYVERLAVWRGYEAELETLAIYSIGIAIYTALVFTFYQTIARRDAYVTLKTGGWKTRLTRVVNAGLLFPAVSFLYFAVLAVSLFFLAKEQGVEQILMVSMAVVMSVRVTTYLDQGMSSDLAKLVPLGLLGVLIIQPGYLDLATAWSRLSASVYSVDLLARYFLLFIVVEGAMRGIRAGGLRVSRSWKARRARRAVAPSQAPPEAPEGAVAVKPADEAVVPAREKSRLVVVEEGPAPAPAPAAQRVEPPAAGDKP